MASTINLHRAIVTGASSGIGKAVALAFAKAGIPVALIGRSPEKLETVVSAVQEMGVEVKAYPLDLAKLEEIKDKIALIAEDFGSIDILVNNAGLGYTNSLENTSLTDWQQVINLNLTSVFQCVLGVLPGMRDRQKGTIINVASIAAGTAFPGWGVYCVSKAGLVAFSKVLALEERTNGIRVITICPGSVNTPLWETDTVQADFDRSLMLKPETVAQAIISAVLLPQEAVIETMTLLPNVGTF